MAEESKGEVATQEEPKYSEEQIIGHYRQMRSEIQKIASKISELEQEVQEHQLVIDTLTPLDGERKAFRLMGGILVERTVKEVLPDVTQNQAGVQDFLAKLAERLNALEAQANAWQKKYNIMTQQEQQAQAQAQQQGRA